MPISHITKLPREFSDQKTDSKRACRDQRHDDNNAGTTRRFALSTKEKKATPIRSYIHLLAALVKPGTNRSVRL